MISVEQRTFQIGDLRTCSLVLDNAQDLGRRVLKHGRAAGQPQQGARTNGHTLTTSGPGAGLATLVKGQLPLFGTQALGAAGGGREQRRQALGEHLALTGRIAAKELADVEGQPHRRVGPWQVGDGASVATMDGARKLAAERAACLDMQRGQFKANMLVGRHNSIQAEAGQPGKQ